MQKQGVIMHQPVVSRHPIAVLNLTGADPCSCQLLSVMCVLEIQPMGKNRAHHEVRCHGFYTTSSQVVLPARCGAGY